jgi:hypothetical protein
LLYCGNENQYILYLSRILVLNYDAFFAGQIGYALAPMIARGVMLGSDQPVILHLLDIPPAATSLEGVRMELIDAAFPLVKGVLLTFHHQLIQGMSMGCINELHLTRAISVPSSATE